MIFATQPQSVYGRKQMRLIFFQFALGFVGKKTREKERLESDRESEMRLFYFELFFALFCFVWAM